MKEKKVLIILNTFNRSNLIEETLVSIQGQTYKHFLCYIIDDNSNDSTPDVVKSFTEKDNRFKYFVKSSSYPKGLSAGRNYGLDLARDLEIDFLQFFDDDDIMHPQKLELQTRDLLENPGAQLSICGIKNFKKLNEISWKETNKLLQPKGFSLGEAYLTGLLSFVAQVPLFRYQYAKNFRFDEDLFYAEEWTLFSKHFFLDPPEGSFINEVLFYRRKHSESITERMDEDFSKRKSSAVTNIKIFRFLERNRIHTKVSILYFLKQFLLYKYDSALIRDVEIQIRKNFPKLKMRYAVAVFLHKNFRKIILKILRYD